MLCCHQCCDFFPKLWTTVGKTLKETENNQKFLGCERFLKAIHIKHCLSKPVLLPDLANTCIQTHFLCLLFWSVEIFPTSDLLFQVLAKASNFVPSEKITLCQSFKWLSFFFFFYEVQPIETIRIPVVTNRNFFFIIEMRILWIIV